MLICFLKQILKYISSNLVLILNICYYIKKLNYELFSSNESSNSDLVKLSINLNLIDLLVISALILVFYLTPMYKRTLFGDSARTEKAIVNSYLTNYFNQGNFKVTVLGTKSILIAKITEQERTKQKQKQKKQTGSMTVNVSPAYVVSSFDASA